MAEMAEKYLAAYEFCQKIAPLEDGHGAQWYVGKDPESWDHWKYWDKYEASCQSEADKGVE